jgi:hypothetical protein
LDADGADPRKGGEWLLCDRSGSVQSLGIMATANISAASRAQAMNCLDELEIASPILSS